MPRDLSRRNRQPEVMDQPDLDAGSMVETLDGLSLVNALTFSARIVWPDIAASHERRPGRRLRVLDVACGGGDTLLRLHRKAQRAGLDIDFAGCDISPVAVDHARATVEKAGAEIAFFAHDVTRDALPEGFDMIMCSLFLHHLDEDEAIAFLRGAAQRAGERLLIHDLRRSRMSHLFARIGTRFLMLNDICREDGARSVEGAFTPQEAADLAREAGLDGAETVTRFPFRYLVRWVRP